MEMTIYWDSHGDPLSLALVFVGEYGNPVYLYNNKKDNVVVISTEPIKED